VIRAYNNDDRQQDKFDRTNLESTRLNIFVNRVMALMQPVNDTGYGLGIGRRGMGWFVRSERRAT